MSKNISSRIYASFSEYFNKDGEKVKVEGVSLTGEVLWIHNMTFNNRSERVASVSCANGDLYFVPFDSLVF